MSQIDTDLAQRLVRLYAEKRACEEQLKCCKVDIAELSERLLDQFAESGLARLTIADANGDNMTVYPHMVERCSVAAGHDKTEVADALRKHGHGDLVREDFNLNSLSSLLRELRDGGDDLDPEILNLISIRTDSTMRVVKG